MSRKRPTLHFFLKMLKQQTILLTADVMSGC